MKRRTFLALLSGSTIVGGSALAYRHLKKDPKQLRFVRIKNASPQDNSIRVHLSRNGDTVHDEVFDLPGFDPNALDRQNATYVGEKPHVAFVPPTWDTSLATFDVAYKMAGESAWNTVDLDAKPTTNVAVEIAYLGVPPAPDHRVLAFDDTDELQSLWNLVAEELDTIDRDDWKNSDRSVEN